MTAENQLIFWRKRVDYPAQAGSLPAGRQGPDKKKNPSAFN
ncbi:hypothetical protein [Shinella zoogloeoides]